MGHELDAFSFMTQTYKLKGNVKLEIESMNYDHKKRYDELEKRIKVLEDEKIFKAKKKDAKRKEKEKYEKQAKLSQLFN